MPEVAEHIQEQDTGLLLALTDISCTYSDSYDSFTLTFKFSENEWIENEELTKTYTVDPDLLTDDSPNLVENIGTEIKWKQGKDLTVEVS